MDLSLQSKIDLNDGHAIPQLGFGVFQITDPAELSTAVECALDCGYRHFDTAKVYKNEASLGEVLAKSGVPREELYLTTKCWLSDFSKTKTRETFESSLEKLQSDYVDLYLLHWPEDHHMMEAWETLIALQAEGKIKSIGVSNFSVARFEEFFFQHTDVVPAVNQIELHPQRAQLDVQDYCRSLGCAVEAYSPLARAGILQCDALKTLAAEIGKTPAQLILRWHLQQGIIVIPKSVHPERIRENCELYDFSLNEAQMALIDRLNTETSIISWRPNDGVGWY